MEKVYFSAFLSCWLCKFVLLAKEDLIRPSVFQVVSMMASGSSFSLVVPILANIYNGLKEVLFSSSLIKCDASFPIHYVYVWLAEYFSIHHLNMLKLTNAQMIQFGGEK